MTINIARTFALSVVSVGIIGGAAVSMAGLANAATQTQPTGPGYSYCPARTPNPAPPAPATGPGVSDGPAVTANPAPQAQPGWHGHHGVNHIEHLVSGYRR